MVDRRQFLFGAAALLSAEAAPVAGWTEGALLTLRQAAQKRGIEIGAFASVAQSYRPAFTKMLSEHFTLAANISDEMEWDANPGFEFDPPFGGLTNFLNRCRTLGLRPRARQIYSKEALPPNAHLRPDGTPKNKSELEKTLVKRVEQVCAPLKGRNAIIQVIDEILADHEGGLRKDPFSTALGEQYVDLLFHAAHAAAPDALLIYQEYGPEIGPNGFLKRKTKDYVALLERLRKRDVPITGAALGGFMHPQLVLQKSLFKTIEDLEYDIHITELTQIYAMRGEAEHWYPKNAEENDRVVQQRYVKAFAFLCQLKRLREITFFAPVDNDNTVESGSIGIAIYPDARPGLFNLDLTPKPVYRAVTDAVLKSTASA